MKKLSIGIALLVLLVGCGYHFPGQATALPGGGSRLRVGRFENRSREPGLENDVARAMEDEVARRGIFQIVKTDGEADLVLEGTINSLDTNPVAFSTSDSALQYQTVMTVSASLRDPHSGRVVWQVTGLHEDDSYGAVSNTVVTESSAFAQSTLNANDLNRLAEIQLSESQRRDAIERVLSNTSRDIYNSMVEDF
jgi:outer membrane lipopolysaccharide assembly protein LptE/RlpB